MYDTAGKSVNLDPLAFSMLRGFFIGTAIVIVWKTNVMSLIPILISLLIFLVVIYVAKLIMDQLGTPQPIRIIMFLIALIFLIIWLARRFGWY